MLDLTTMGKIVLLALCMTVVWTLLGVAMEITASKLKRLIAKCKCYIDLCERQQSALEQLRNDIHDMLLEAEAKMSKTEEMHAEFERELDKISEELNNKNAEN